MSFLTSSCFVMYMMVVYGYKCCWWWWWLIIVDELTCQGSKGARIMVVALFLSCPRTVHDASAFRNLLATRGHYCLVLNKPFLLFVVMVAKVQRSFDRGAQWRFLLLARFPILRQVPVLKKYFQTQLCLCSVLFVLGQLFFWRRE